ncbi:DUF6266 family protein [Pedobacter sp. GR22-6]|uniref:DUF6266 family protein n=1 Tax=Pedobacter sp. GR22-6 TaxID=3127957 RepID=UPI00307F2097
MGILKNGIFGGFQQKTGPLTGRRVKGRNVITGLHRPSTIPLTDAQNYHNEKFNHVFEFQQPLKALIANGFKYVFKKGNAFTQALSYNFQHALVDEGTEYRLNYRAFLYSKGSLEAPFNPLASFTSGAVLYKWALTSHCDYDDLATFMVYNEDQNLFASSVDAVKRSACGYALQLPEPFAHGKIHCYMSLRSAKHRKVSNSIYVGLITL